MVQPMDARALERSRTTVAGRLCLTRASRQESLAKRRLQLAPIVPKHEPRGEQAH